ncbi:MAG TPA: ABC transporter permease subunit [Candidatus Binataceae bacterium]|jgi:molybdate/tungstate transport system permease protein|nr:ABC transporter permease subunit [Candidatus Binataceae bacterium]
MRRGALLIGMRRGALNLGAIGALSFLVLPFAFFAWATPWGRLHAVAGDFDAVRVSVVYTLAALALIVIGGTPLAYWMARREFRGKTVCEGLVLLPLLTPPLAMGLLLALLYGPHSMVGATAARLGLELTNTPTAFVLAQVYAAAPYYVIAARAAFESVDPELEQIALTLGKTPWQVFRLVTAPLARLGLAVGLAMAWVRALGEFGIVLVIAYFPQGIPVKLWVNLQDLGLDAIYPLLWIFFLVALPLPLLLGIVSRSYVMRTETV